MAWKVSKREPPILEDIVTLNRQLCLTYCSRPLGSPSTPLAWHEALAAHQPVHAKNVIKDLLRILEDIGSF